MASEVKAASKSETKADKPRATLEVNLKPAPAGAELTEGQIRYRGELRHIDMDGTEVEVVATDEAAARAMVEAAMPDDATIERMVPLEVGSADEPAKAATKPAAKDEPKPAPAPAKRKE